eukprot:5765167-Pleurochrysis_carterae.AAC.1
MKQELDSVLTPYGESAVGGESYAGIVWDIRHMMSTVIKTADSFDNLQLLQPENPFLATRRMQLRFDGVGWTRGRGCTLLLVR